MKHFTFSAIVSIVVLNLFLTLGFALPAQAAGNCPEQKQFSLVVRCQGTPIKDGNGAATGECECTFNDVMAQLKRIMDVAFLAALPLTVIAITWAGIQILLAQGNTGKISDAKKMATQILTGFIFVLIAWLLVYTFMKFFLKPEYYTQFINVNN